MRYFTTCPPSSATTPADYPDRLVQVARWSEEAGAEGALIYADNSLVDPWTVAQIVLGSTRRLVPMVAMQPVYLSPYGVAKKIASLALFYHRRVALNLIVGGFVKDLAALGDRTPHDQRYSRLEEHAGIVAALLRGELVSLEGRHYHYENLRLAPDLPADLQSELFISSSSKAGRDAAATLGATPVSYPQPPEKAVAPEQRPTRMVRLGLLARDTAAEAWAEADARFPGDAHGKMKHKLAMAVSDSNWHRQLSQTAAESSGTRSVYWLHPFETHRSFCPYLVGSHADVAAVLRSYRKLGVDSLIVDVPQSREDLVHIQQAVADAAKETVTL